MGYKRDWIIVCMVFDAWLWPLVQGSEEFYNRDSLDSYVYDYAIEKMHSPRTAKLYNITLPANFSGVEVSFVRLRARGLWKNGANHSLFTIPQGVLPFPFAMRVDLVYQNLGNMSSAYYNVPNYTYVAPVIGLLAYDPNKTSLVELEIMGTDPIIAHFPNILVEEDGSANMKCVRFDTNGTLELSNMTVRSSCVVRRQGHFSVVVPYRRKTDKVIKWRMSVAIVGGVVGLILIFVVAIAVYKWIKGKRIKQMERQTETGEGLDSIWIGRSRMPSASGIRTQPVLENSYLP